MAAIHTVRFPALLRGEVGPTTTMLCPADPADDLQASLNESGMKAELRRRHDPLERWATSLPDRLRHAPSTCGA